MQYSNKFPFGELRVTRAINDSLDTDNGLALQRIIYRYGQGDWGKTNDADSKLNNEALALGERIVAFYDFAGQEITIITEANRQDTTIMFKGEY
jgi:hypothetical protein